MGDQLAELGHSSVVVAVEVAGQQVVDSLQPCLLRRLVHAFGIPAVLLPFVARIHQQRFPGGRDDQGGRSTFHVHKVNFQGPGGGGSLGRSLPVNGRLAGYQEGQ